MIKKIIGGGFGIVSSSLIGGSLFVYITSDNEIMPPYYQAAIEYAASYQAGQCVSDKKIKNNGPEKELEEKIVDCIYSKSLFFSRMLSDFNKFRLAKYLLDSYKQKHNLIPEKPLEPVNAPFQFMYERA